MLEISNKDLEGIKKKYGQVEVLEYKDYVNVCENLNEIPIRRKYFTGRALNIIIKSSVKEFRYNVRLTMPDSFEDKLKLDLIEKEIKRQIALDLNRW